MGTGSMEISCSGRRGTLRKRRKTKITANRPIIAKRMMMIMFLGFDLGAVAASRFCRSGFGLIKCAASSSTFEMSLDREAYSWGSWLTFEMGFALETGSSGWISLKNFSSCSSTLDFLGIFPITPKRGEDIKLTCACHILMSDGYSGCSAFEQLCVHF